MATPSGSPFIAPVAMAMGGKEGAYRLNAEAVDQLQLRYHASLTDAMRLP